MCIITERFRSTQMEPVETRINCTFIMSEILRNSQIHSETNRNETAIESQMTTANLRFHRQFCVQNRVVLTTQKNPECPGLPQSGVDSAADQHGRSDTVNYVKM